GREAEDVEEDAEAAHDARAGCSGPLELSLEDCHARSASKRRASAPRPGLRAARATPRTARTFGARMDRSSPDARSRAVVTQRTPLDPRPRRTRWRRASSPVSKGDA